MPGGDGQRISPVRWSGAKAGERARVMGVGHPVVGAADRDLAVPAGRSQPVALGGDGPGREPEHAEDAGGLFFAVYGRALQAPQQFEGFLEHVVADWMNALAGRRCGRSPDPEVFYSSERRAASEPK
ncbi:MAG: putative regulatory protein [Actinomycetia bacterium]|nr:putative regulatory protein [Actinomycetes bacterium]